MDTSTIQSLQDLLRLPGSDNILVHDTSVLSCGCLVSEHQFISQSLTSCPSCHKYDVHLLKPVLAMRLLYKIINGLMANDIDMDPSIGQGDENYSSKIPKNISIPSSKRTSSFAAKSSSLPPDLDLLGLFCKFAKEEQSEKGTTNQPIKNSLFSIEPPPPRTIIASRGNSSTSLNSLPQNSLVSTLKVNPEKGQFDVYEENLALGLDGNEERNFSQCFPFHRKVSSFPTQQGKIPFSSRSLIKRISRFTGSAIFTQFDARTQSEITLFVLISDKKWELYRYSSSKPTLLACGKLTGEYGPNSSALESPKSDGLIVHNDFGDKKKLESGKSIGKSDLVPRLKSWIQLHCCLSGRYLVILGTKGLMRVLNVDPNCGEIGQPVYTYIIDFPIRCIALAPNNRLIACGITTKEKMTGNPQPFVILHQIDEAKANMIGKPERMGPGLVTPITITVPYRDPLKILTFNASSTHLLCCTVYEMRYFIIRLRGDHSLDYRKPRLIFSDTRLSKKEKNGRNIGTDESIDGVGNFLDSQDDDQMLDNEGITDIKFGRPFTNTIIITSSSLKNKPSVILKINGPSLDFRQLSRRVLLGELGNERGVLPGAITSDEDETAVFTDVEVLMKLHEIGSNVYGAEVSPRGDSIVFVDKLGRLLLLATKNGNRNLNSLMQTGSAVVLLGEVSPALRYNEAASVCFSSDGGKVMVIDRKGVFQVFDFTKGIPGEDPDVIKCKIINLR